MNPMMLALSGGGGDPKVFELLQEMEREKSKKIKALITLAAENGITVYNWLKPAPKVVDATGKELAAEDPRLPSLLLKYQLEHDKKIRAIEKGLETLTKAVLSVLEPSESEAKLWAALADKSGSKKSMTVGEARLS